MMAWSCRRRRAALVDLALGTLAASDVPRIEAHLARCAACRADLDAIRGISHALVDEMPVRPAESFWLEQRQAIMRRVRTAPAPATPIRWPRWQVAGAFATVALAVLLGRSMLAPIVRPTPTTIDRLDDDVLLHLHDLLPAIAPASAIDDADGDILSVHDLGDAELDSLHGLLDDRS